MLGSRLKHIFKATAFIAVAFVVYSCGGKLKETDISLKDMPVQAIRDMFAVQTKDGVVLQRFESPLMQKFETDTINFDFFPEGISVYGYTEDGLLESIIKADKARHVQEGKKHTELWEAYGNVFIHNVIKCETMETDTLYWDSDKAEIYTNCYVKLYSRDGMMQGYGMRSDDHARNAILFKSFNSYGYTQQDTTDVLTDTVNFIGPLRKQ